MFFWEALPKSGYGKITKKMVREEMEAAASCRSTEPARERAHDALAHPGPRDPDRIASLVGRGVSATGTLPAGLTVNAALAAFMRGARMRGGAAALEGGAFAPFRYVMPALSTDGVHAAWYSEPHAPAGVTRLERANATFGPRDGAPFAHLHGVWREADGRRTGGHLLPHDCVIAEPIGVAAWGWPTTASRRSSDPGTAFKIFHPVRGFTAAPPAEGSRSPRSPASGPTRISAGPWRSWRDAPASGRRSSTVAWEA